MQPVHRFTLDTTGSERTAQSALRFDGRQVAMVHGSRIDAQFAWNDAGYLLFVSFDHLFSAVETIYFLDRAGRVRDAARLGHAMAEGLISDILVEGASRISFRFPMNEAHVVEVRRRASWLGLKTRWLSLR